MNAASTVAIDLPLKALAWQDADANVWLGSRRCDRTSEIRWAWRTLGKSLCKTRGVTTGITTTGMEHTVNYEQFD